MANGSFTMTGGSILSSSAQYGGAVYISGNGNPSFSMSGGTISDCISQYHGGAVFLEGGSVTISGGSIERNKSLEANGGGVYLNKGNFTMSAGSISGNYADDNGGGVYVSSVSTNVSATISGGSITGNTAEMYGGGLCVLPGGGAVANVTLGVLNQGWLNPDISSNRSRIAGGGIYTAGANARIVINSGKILGNNVTAYVANEDVANEGGMVTLNDGDVTHVDVTFHANGGFFDDNGNNNQDAGEGDTKVQKIVTSTNSKLVTPTAFYRMGYHFVGWNTRADGAGVSYANGDTMNITEDVDLYIIWALD